MSVRLILGMILGVSLVFGLAACGGGDAAGTSTSVSSAQGGSSMSSAAPGGDVTVSPAMPPGSEGSPSSNGGGAAGNDGSAGSDDSANGSIPPSPPARRGGHGGGRGHATGAAGFIAPTSDNSIPEYGSEAISSQKAEATAVLRAYLEAWEGGSWGAACARMGAPVRGQVEALANASNAKAVDCEEAFETLSEFSSASERVNPLSGGLAAFRVKGEKAFALFYGPRNQQFMMPMVEEGGAWKVNQIAPVTYPPGAPPTGG